MQDKIQEKRKKLYDGFIAAGYEEKDFAYFNNLIDRDEASRRWVYNAAKSEGWRVGDTFEEFEGYILPSKSTDKSPSTFTGKQLGIDGEGWKETALTATAVSEGVMLSLLLFICIKRIDKEKLKYIFLAFFLGIAVFVSIFFIKIKEHESRYYFPEKSAGHVLIDKKEHKKYIWDVNKGEYKIHRND